jgi:hypothetical protein
MGWKDLHWEKIPGQSDKDVLKKQLEEANKDDIPVRLVRARQKDGKEGMYFEWFVKKRDCDIEGCTSKASNITMHIDNTTYYTLAMCSYHYEDFQSQEGLEKPFNMKDTVYVKQKYN